MIDGISKELCTGCDACNNVCPQGAITMVKNELGFRYPKVDYDICIKCKKCVCTCPSIKEVSREDKWDKPQIFAAWSLDEYIRDTSTSGGIFSELAKEMINEDGLVVGAKYNKEHLVEHYIANDYNGIEKLKQSKYIQSEIGTIYKTIRKELKLGRKLAFCGSPCQVAGLLNFLDKPYSNLTTFDFVCRGTNSPKAYRKYLDMLEGEYKSDIERVWFKNKTYGWNRFSTRIDFKNGKTYIKDRYNDLFMRGYIEENLYMRECCFQCKYKNFPRIADITLADFWGVGCTDPGLDEDKGTSLVMVNSDKGLNLLRNISNKIFHTQLTIDKALPGNPAINSSAVKNEQSKEFLLMLDNASFDSCFKRYAKNVGIKRFMISIGRQFTRAISIINKITSKKREPNNNKYIK